MKPETIILENQKIIMMSLNVLLCGVSAKLWDDKETQKEIEWYKDHLSKAIDNTNLYLK